MKIAKDNSIHSVGETTINEEPTIAPSMAGMKYFFTKYLSKNSRYFMALIVERSNDQKPAKTTAVLMLMNNPIRGIIMRESPNPIVEPIRLANAKMSKIIIATSNNIKKDNSECVKKFFKMMAFEII